MQAPDFLKAGIKHMQDRASTYDKPEGERSMSATVAAFNAVTGDGVMNTEERGWLFMQLLKAVRSQQGDFKADNYEDGASYVGLCGEAAAKERSNQNKHTDFWLPHETDECPVADEDIVDAVMESGRSVAHKKAKHLSWLQSHHDNARIVSWRYSKQAAMKK